MKKFFLIIFFVQQLFAGRTFIDPEIIIHQYTVRLESIRLRWGGLKQPPGVEEKLSFIERAQLFREFRNLWDEFQSNKKIIRSNFDTAAKRLVYEEFLKQFVQTKNKYEDAMDKELCILKKIDGGDRR